MTVLDTIPKINKDYKDTQFVGDEDKRITFIKYNNFVNCDFTEVGIIEYAVSCTFTNCVFANTDFFFTQKVKFINCTGDYTL